MKTLSYVKNNIEEFERDKFLDKRFTKRLMSFLSEDEWEAFGFKYAGENEFIPVEWTEENVLEQLKKDVAFGIEKATDHRDISSELMVDVCLAWLDVLEDEDIPRNLWGWYGCDVFKAIDTKYNFGLVDVDTFDEKFYSEW